MSKELLPPEDKAAGKPKRHWRSKNLPHSFVVRASNEEHRKLKELAKQTGLSLSRLVIEGTFAKSIRTSGQAAAERAATEELFFEIKRIGISLSQINSALYAARRVGEKFAAETRLDELTGAVEEVLGRLRKNL